MTTDEVVSIYYAAEDLARAGKMEEACAQYQRAYDICESSFDPDLQSRQKVFAGKMGGLLYKLGRYAECRQYYTEIGQPVPKVPPSLQSSRQGITLLKSLGFLSELTDQQTDQLFEDCFPNQDDAEGTALPSILQNYYGHLIGDEQPPKTSRMTPLSPRAVRDGYTWYDHRFANDSEDVVADFAELVGGKPLFRSKKLDFYNTPFVVIVEDQSGSEN